MTQLLLASASPARLATLRSAGLDPLVRVAGIDEDAVIAQSAERFGPLDVVDLVLLLAQAKAESVASEEDDVLVLGCDSMLELDGVAQGKPADPEQARARWQSMRGRSGVLHTGHWLIDTRDLEGDGTGATIGATASAVVHFADLSDEEIDAYVTTGEPLNVAGAFTIDGLGGPFITRIDGDPHTVVGVSLPLLRELVREMGVSVMDLWRG